MENIPSQVLIVRFESGAHWSTGDDAVATVRFNHVVHIADKKAWAKGEFAHPRRGEVWLVTVGERSPWGSTYRLNPVRCLSAMEASILPQGVNAMAVQICTDYFCKDGGACQIAAMLRQRHPSVAVKEAGCLGWCNVAPVVVKENGTIVEHAGTTEAAVDALVSGESAA